MTFESSTRATLNVFGRDQIEQTNAASTAATSSGNETGLCTDVPDIKNGEVRGTATSTGTAGLNGAWIELHVLAEAVGGRRATGPCAAGKTELTPSHSKAESHIKVTFEFSKTAVEASYEFSLKSLVSNAAGIVTKNWLAFQDGRQVSNGFQNFHNVDDPFTVSAKPGTKVRVELNVEADVRDAAMDRQVAYTVEQVSIRIEQAPLLAQLRDSQQRVIGGRDAAEDDYPFVGAVAIDRKPHCSGILIGPKTILTAAHCIAGRSMQKMEFMLGPSFSDPKSRFFPITSGTYPQNGQFDNSLNYNPQTYEADIAVLYTAMPPVEATIIPGLFRGDLAALTAILTKMKPQPQMEFVGYGYADATLSSSSIGRKRLALIPVRNFKETRFNYGTEEVNTCYGDSGGPSYVVVPGSAQLAGIVSFGDPACKKFGVNITMTNEKYRNWILARVF